MAPSTEPSADEPSRKRMAAGGFFFLAGLIIAISEWPTHMLGYPLMLLGVLIPAILWYRQHKRLQSERRAFLSQRKSKALRPRGSEVYEIRSRTARKVAQ